MPGEARTIDTNGLGGTEPKSPAVARGEYKPEEPSCAAETRPDLTSGGDQVQGKAAWCGHKFQGQEQRSKRTWCLEAK